MITIMKGGVHRAPEKTCCPCTCWCSSRFSFCGNSDRDWYSSYVVICRRDPEGAGTSFF